MTDRRHQNYRLALSSIEQLGTERIGQCHEDLREIAQDLLLSREAGESTEDLADRAALDLNYLVSRSLLSERRAGDIWAVIYACGPEPEVDPGLLLAGVESQDGRLTLP